MQLRDLSLVETGQGVGAEQVPDEVSVVDEALECRVARQSHAEIEGFHMELGRDRDIGLARLPARDCSGCAAERRWSALRPKHRNRELLWRP